MANFRREYASPNASKRVSGERAKGTVAPIAWTMELDSNIFAEEAPTPSMDKELEESLFGGSSGAEDEEEEAADTAGDSSKSDEDVGLKSRSLFVV